MKKILTLILPLLMAGCSLLDGDSSSSSSSSGNVSMIKMTTSTSTDPDYCSFKYDSRGRVSKYLYTETYTGDEGYEEWSVETSFTYSGSTIIADVIARDGDELDFTFTMLISLDARGVLSEMTLEGSSATQYFTSDDEGRVISSSFGSTSSSNTFIWSGDNMIDIGDDLFEFSDTILNDSNIDLNMFLTASEDLEDNLYSIYFGFLKEIGGIHSANMISQCSEEGSTYDIEYQLDSKGRVIEARWDKYGRGNYVVVEISY